MTQNKFLFGITGGSGCGKTTVSDIFRNLGYEVIDCDKISREISAKNSPCLSELKNVFGEKILLPDGSLDRKALGNIVFSSQASLKTLNDITHKYILEEIYKRADISKSRIIGIDGAVLIESGVSKKCRRMIAVLADRKIRAKRIIKRDNLTPEEAENRINSQKVDNFYIESCDYILYNNSDRATLENQVREVSLKLEEERKKSMEF